MKNDIFIHINTNISGISSIFMFSWWFIRNKIEKRKEIWNEIIDFLKAYFKFIFYKKTGQNQLSFSVFSKLYANYKKNNEI